LTWLRPDSLGSLLRSPDSVAGSWGRGKGEKEKRRGSGKGRRGGEGTEGGGSGGGSGGEREGYSLRMKILATALTILH